MVHGISGISEHLGGNYHILSSFQAGNETNDNRKIN